MELKEKLVTLRKKKGLSQLELAEMVKVSRQAVSRWEVGSTIPSTTNLQYLSDLYDVPLEYLLNETVELSPEKEESRSMEIPMVESTSKGWSLVKTVGLVFLILIILIIIFVFTLATSKSEETVASMNDVLRGEVEISSSETFSFDW